MRKFYLILFVFCLSSKLCAQIDVHKLVQSQLKVVESYVEEIETFQKNKTSGEIKNFNKAFDAAIFLEELTGIKSDVDAQHDVVYTPSRKNLRKWKAWYRKNKKTLHWDEIERKINF